jgi:peptide deformylase
MAIRDILTVPDPLLKQISTAVDAVDDGLRALMDDMLETMYAALGRDPALRGGLPVGAGHLR